MTAADSTLGSQLFTLAGQVLWPLTLLVVLFFTRHELRRGLSAIVARVADPKTAVDISRGGLRLGVRQDATEAKVTSNEMDIEQLKATVFKVHNAEPDHSSQKSMGEEQTVPADLVKMADHYCEIFESDWATRVRLKDEAARDMAAYVIQHRVPRPLLAEQHHDGLILALAATIHSFPTIGDFDLLLRVTDETNRLHVKYRIVLALGRLAERGLVPQRDFRLIRRVLDTYEHDADSSLLSRLQQTRSLLDQVERVGAFPI